MSFIKYFVTLLHNLFKVYKFVFMKNFKRENNLVEGEDYYITPEGYRCFTEKYHLDRGFCCKNSCRHCPYLKPETSKKPNKNFK